MAKIRIPTWIQHYLNEFGDRPGASSKLVKVAAEYEESIRRKDETYIHRAKETQSLNRQMGTQHKIDLPKEKKQLEEDHKQKALAVARQYVQDTDELNRINPEIKAEYTEKELSERGGHTATQERPEKDEFQQEKKDQYKELAHEVAEPERYDGWEEKNRHLQDEREIETRRPTPEEQEKTYKAEKEFNDREAKALRVAAMLKELEDDRQRFRENGREMTR